MKLIKRLLFLIPLLFINLLHADTITSGVGLIKPTTGQIDKTRSWADKYNSNFDTIASSLNTTNTRLNSIALTTPSVPGLLLFRTTAEVNLDGLNLFKSTSEVKESGFTLFKSTSETKESGLSLFKSTAEVKIDGFSLFKSTSEIKESGFTVYKSTAEIKIDGLNLFKSTAQTRIDTMETNFSTGFRSNGSSTFTTVTANYFLGDGSKLTGISAGGASTSSVITDLIITTAGADTNTYVFTATNIDIMGFYAINFSTTAAMNKVGAGGTDGIVGDPTFTWVKFWAASNGSTCTVVITSGDVTIPTLPTGYTKWRLLGGGYNDGSSNLQPIYKRGNFVRYKFRRTFLNGVNPPEAGVGTAVDMTTYYPPWAIAVQLGYIGNSLVNSVSVLFRTSEDVGDTWVDAQFDSLATDNVGGATATRLGHQIFLNVQGSQTLYYRSISDCSTLRAAIGGYTEDFR